jgi:hypothetical protein
MCLESGKPPRPLRPHGAAAQTVDRIPWSGESVAQLKSCIYYIGAKLPAHARITRHNEVRVLMPLKRIA